MLNFENNQDVPKGLVVRHKCDNTLCVNPDHLLLGTQRQNIEDMIARDRARYVRGSLHPLSKVTTEIVQTARKMRRGGNTTAEIASHFHLGQSTMSHILNTRSRYDLAVKLVRDRPEQRKTIKELSDQLILDFTNQEVSENVE